jgi:hypothetical protein
VNLGDLGPFGSQTGSEKSRDRTHAPTGITVANASSCG